ncbi:hypothetical protein PC9H_005835 [Pleurotus ostreatus]|uniref:Uncharacterized protein n=1 Tax=Pleurotus ostreatus TaxID=5322 RepID=A0A8H6ZVK2_PLEOS|nr:uncharacterized protein PC9H_005835 [Pleurotus ostreatus]KAF7430135.1 hypothetical protein PC9H_005835 [Pleurotus ostreatus]
MATGASYPFSLGSLAHCNSTPLPSHSNNIFVAPRRSPPTTRSSPTAHPSALIYHPHPWELRSDDIVEFGIDIVGDDNKILHYTVAAPRTPPKTMRPDGATCSDKKVQDAAEG